MDDNDDSLTGLLLNITIGAVVLAVEISAWLIAAVCMAIVAIVELFFEEGPE